MKTVDLVDPIHVILTDLTVTCNVMTFFNLDEDVYLVKGASNSALYNLASKEIFSISAPVAKLIERSGTGNIEALNLDQAAKETLEHLVSIKTGSFALEKSKLKEFPKPEKKIKSVALELTKNCNFRCIHCYAECNKKKDDSLSPEQFIDIIEQIYHTNPSPRRIQLIGGEPLLYGKEKIFQIINSTRKLNPKTPFEVFTNGYLLDEEYIEFFANNNVSLAISIYSADPEIHDSITKVPGSFEKIKNTIGAIKEKGIKLRVGYVLMKQNETTVEETKNFLNEMGCSKHYDVVRPIGRGKDPDITPSKEFYKTRKEPDFVADREDFFNNIYYNPCWFGNFYVQNNGKVSPCYMSLDITLGDLTKQSVKEILGSEILDSYWEQTKEKMDDCKLCEYRLACHDCRPVAIANGGINAKTHGCNYSPETGKWDN